MTRWTYRRYVPYGGIHKMTSRTDKGAACILGRPPADFELLFAAQETARVLVSPGRPQEGAR
jgi:hypothetical protein